MIHEPLPVPAGPGPIEPAAVATAPTPAIDAGDRHRPTTRPAPKPATPDVASSLRHPDAPASAPGLLRGRLIRTDAVVIAVVWTAVIIGAPMPPSTVTRIAAAIALAVAVTLAALGAQGLYRARVCAVRRVARRRLALASLAAPVALVATGAVTGDQADWNLRLAVGAVATFVGLSVAREVFEQWLRSSRVRGRHVRPVLVSGSADEVAQVVRLLEAHPEVGCRAVAWAGPRPERAPSPDLAVVPWVGTTADLVDAAALVGASGVLMGPSVAADPSFPELAKQLQARDIHIQVSSGLWGIDPCRLRALPMAHEPFFYLEPARQGQARRRVKRVADVVIAVVVLILTSPILLVSAVLIKLHDGGPVLFRQTRIGLGGAPFQLHKLRTMEVDAESRLAALADRNQRSGPLFKIDVDPRVTPVGRVLRACSIDELPQLADVIMGRLSLVGPRPALPDEVAAFDDVLLGRHRVLPGVTGLWQVEARHNPSFHAYRHLDLFYVENWTLGLDLAILAATVKTVLTDGAGALASRTRPRGAASDEEVLP